MLDLFRTLPGLMSNIEGSAELREALVFAAWRRIAGPAVAEHTAPIKLEKAVLTLAVSNLMWQRQLKELGGQMLFKLNAALGSPMVSFIQLDIDEAAVLREHGEKNERQEEYRQLAARELTPDLIQAAEAIEDEEFREQFLAAAGNCLVRRARSESRL